MLRVAIQVWYRTLSFREIQVRFLFRWTLSSITSVNLVTMETEPWPVYPTDSGVKDQSAFVCIGTSLFSIGGITELFINSAIHKAVGLSAAVQNSLWRPFLPLAPIHSLGTFFSGTVEWWNSTGQSREAMRPAAL